MSRTLVGVDLGGTNIRAALATGEATHGEPIKYRTPAADGPPAVIDAVIAAAREAAGGARLDGVAVGIPGPLDAASGVVFAAPHLAGWTDVPARELLQERAGCPVAIENDANLAAYAEWLAGAGRGTRHFAFITVSTGIGGGLILDGQLFTGAAGTAGEVGHTPLGMSGAVCGQGHVGCLEGAASGTAIANRARDALATGERSSLSTLAPGDIDARAVQEAAANGDQLATRLFAEAGRALGRAVGGLINLLSPEVVAIGGGVVEAGELLLSSLRSGVGEIAFHAAAIRCRIVPAGLGTDAGLVGAAAWAGRCFGEAG